MLDVTYMPDETNEGIGFAMMQAMLFGILKAQVLTHTGKAIIRNHQDFMDARTALTELVAHYRNSTGAIAVGHALCKELLTMRLTKDVRVSRHEFPASYSDTKYVQLSRAHSWTCGSPDVQLLSYLQEAVSLDSELNQL